MIIVKAKLNNIRISSKKVNLVADAIRGLDVVSALHRLQVLFKKSSPVIEKLLKSAIANAIDRYNVKEEDLIIKSIVVNKGMALKRWKPAAFGRAHPFKKHSSHIAIELTVKEGVKAELKQKDKKEIETVDLTKTDKKVSGKGKEDTKFKQDKSKQAVTQVASKTKERGRVKTG